MGWVWFALGIVIGYIMAALMTVASWEDRMNESRAYREAEKRAEGVPEPAMARSEGATYLPDLPEER